jgi:hypothetical protein
MTVRPGGKERNQGQDKKSAPRLRLEARISKKHRRQNRQSRQSGDSRYKPELHSGMSRRRQRRLRSPKKAALTRASQRERIQERLMKRMEGHSFPPVALTQITE